MSRRAYVILLEDDGSGEDDPWSWFEECVKESVFDSWNNCGYSEMEYADVLLPGDPEYDENHAPDDEFDSSHVLERVGIAFDQCCARMAESKAE